MTGERVAVIVAHPDDEVLAFGGIMCRHAEAGDQVSLLIMATGLAARSADNSVERGALARLHDDARSAARTLGVTEVSFAEFPDNRMDTVALLDVVKVVESFLTKSGATRVYTHHAGDLNIDHQVVARAVLTACRPLPDAAVRRLYAGEVLSSSEYALVGNRFQPTRYVDISAYLDRKCAAMQCYRSEIRPSPHPRSIEAITALAKLRGSEVGLAAAEGLGVLREIER
jgi:LmbE family N-acetylglucosaminyl deacetylase